MCACACGRCCGCAPLRPGCLLLALASMAVCVSTASVCGWWLRAHRSRRNEDNMVLMSLGMFAALAALSDAGVVLAVLRAVRGGALWLVSRAVCAACGALVCAVALLFSPALRPLLAQPGYAVLAAVVLIGTIGFSVYYLAVVNSVYKQMKSQYDTALPV